MSEKTSLDIKKDLYIQLSFSLYGTLIAYQEKGHILIKSSAFAVDSYGVLFLIVHQAQEISHLDVNKQAVFSVIKEGSSVTSMHEIKFHGKVSDITNDEKERKVAQEIFEKKSPYLSTIPFMSSQDKDYMILKFHPEMIYYQNIQDARANKAPYVLTLS